jgi:hypothetical protein
VPSRFGAKDKRRGWGEAANVEGRVFRGEGRGVDEGI